MNKLTALLATLLLLTISALAYVLLVSQGKADKPLDKPASARADKSSKPADKPTPVEVAVVQSQAVAQQRQVAGTLESQQAIDLATEVEGRIAKIHIPQGQTVKAGTPLVWLDDSILRADLAQAEAEARYARAQFVRFDELAREGLVPRQQRDETVAAKDRAEAALGAIRARLDKLIIRAPFTGVLGLQKVYLGDFVRAGTALVRLERFDPLHIRFEVPERDLSVLKVGLSVQVEGEGAAKIAAIEPRLNTDTRSAVVLAALNNPEQRLRPGQFVQVQLPLQQSSNALLVPEQSLMRQGDSASVYRLKADGEVQRVEKVNVQTGGRYGQNVEIVSGLQANDRIVAAGWQKLKEGASVQAEAVTPVDYRTADEVKG
jgi:membrane fusion protein (multidrug efflux system)